jgi:uncharacterized RDD family membrane protein YckC
MPCVNHAEVATGLLHCGRCGRQFCRNCVVPLRGKYYCATCKSDEVRDIQSGTEAGALELASVGQRFGALWIDNMLLLVVVAVPVVLFAFATARTTRSSANAQTAFTAMYWLTVGGAILGVVVYEALMLSHRGQTLGKMALGIKVVTPEGSDIHTGQAWGRAVLRQVFFSYFALINYLPAFFTKQRTAIHDLACKTRVVRVRR